MTKDDICARLTQEVERLLAENARLQEEKRQDVGIWLRAERDYRAKIDRLTARVRELEKMVRQAYNDAFAEGMKEHTTNRGGTPWHLSKWPTILTPAPASTNPSAGTPSPAAGSGSRP